ncbi:NadS family protein [Nitratidesulfovibrio liaohensis]|uniref:NadS family protein n=1 Tax=Nitratidesulfovibrio liaohensis TaxID=2604158 RepID=UPI00141D9EC4|nr:NadS family protein [Nitratidesulfovibrio liaohensis]NHZ45115.1 helix-turn-helix domain-containing protein [Nitratidesulfovibrio liaohensis]
MDKTLFENLTTSLKEAVDMARERGFPSPSFEVTGAHVKTIRGRIGLSQQEFAALLRVSVKTLQNWEQSRRTPTGPAAALLRIFDRSPDAAIRALQA